MSQTGNGCAHLGFFQGATTQRRNIEASDDKGEPEAVPKAAVEANQATVFGIPSPGGRGPG